MNKFTNDNGAENGVLRDCDAQGQAALLLVESLIHGLIARSALSVEDAVEIMNVAVDAAGELANDGEFPSATADTALAKLEAICQSLSHDL